MKKEKNKTQKQHRKEFELFRNKICGRTREVFSCVLTTIDNISLIKNEFFVNDSKILIILSYSKG